MYGRYKDRVEFLAVYVREAHPVDGWRMVSNDRAGIVFKQPKTAAERTGVAKKCCAALEMAMPLVVDAMDDRVGHAYSGMPDRLYVIDRAGKVAYKGGRGPFGFKPGEMEQSLAMLLLDQAGRANKEQSGKRPAAAEKKEGGHGFSRNPPARDGAKKPQEK
jgi:Iodothyronine deiodinase